MKSNFFNLAKKISRYSTHPQFKIGCVIVKGNSVISVAFNEIKTHPKSCHIYKQLHAEINAVLDASRYELEKAEAYIYREHKNGSTALAKPCVYCESALMKVGIKTIHYTEDGELGERKFVTVKLED